MTTDHTLRKKEFFGLLVLLVAQILAFSSGLRFVLGLLERQGRLNGRCAFVLPLAIRVLDCFRMLAALVISVRITVYFRGQCTPDSYVAQVKSKALESAS